MAEDDPFAARLAELKAKPAEGDDPFAARLAELKGPASVDAAPSSASNPVQASLPPKDEPGFVKRGLIQIGEGIGNIGHVVKDQVSRIPGLIRHPIESAKQSWSPQGLERSAAERHELERGVSDTMLGIPEAGAEAVQNVAATIAPEHVRPYATDEEQAQEARLAPGVRTVGRVGGMVLANPITGATETAGKVGGAVLERAAPKVASGVANIANAIRKVPGSSAAEGLASYEGTAPLAAAATAPEGHRMEAAGQAASDPMGVITALGLGAMAPIRRGILGSEGAQKREYIEKYGEGAKVTPFPGGAGKGGVFNDQLAGLPSGDAGIGEASLRGARGVFSDIEQRHEAQHGYPYRGGPELVSSAEQAARDTNAQSQTDITLAKEQRRAQVRQAKNEALTETSARAQKLVGDFEGEKRQMVSEPYRVVKEQIDARPEARARRDVGPIVSAMQDAIHDLGTNDFARSKLQTQLSLLESRRAHDTGAITLSERELNDLRGNLMRTAKVGQSDVRGKAEAPLREAAFAAKEMVDQGPYRDLNRQFAEGSSEVEAKRQGVGLKKRPGKDRAAEVENLAKRLRKGINDPTMVPNPSVAPEADLTSIRQKITEAEGSAQPALEEARLRNAAARSRVQGTKLKVAAGDEAAIPDRKMLGLNKRIGSEETDLNQLALRLTRDNQNTETAGRSQADLDAFRAAHPAQATNTRLADLARNRLDLQFTLGLPTHGGIFRRLRTGAAHALTDNLTPLAGRVAYGPAKKLDPIAIARALGVSHGATLGEKIKKAIEHDKELRR